MGFHRADSGNIYVDDKKLTDNNIKSWKGYFSYIPQSIYLFAVNIAQNVAFGLEIKEDKLIEVLKKANI
jgi:ATP-binding cassette, subfamily B, bacterial PglK